MSKGMADAEGVLNFYLAASLFLCTMEDVAHYF